MVRNVGQWSLMAALVAICLASSLGTSIAASTQSEGSQEPPTLNGPHVLTEKKVRLSHGGDNVVRSGPGNSYAIVGVYPKDAEFTVLAKRDDWYNIQLSQTNTGWIHSSLCEEFDDMSDLEYRPNPRLFSRIGSFGFTIYTGGYAFDRKSNSIVFGGRLGYYLLEFIEIEGNLGWTHVVRPAEIVESLFGLALEEEDFHMLFYSVNMVVKLLPGRQMVPFITFGAGSSIMQGLTESSINYGAGINFFVRQAMAFRFEFRSIRLDSGTANARRDNTNFEFSIGTTFLF